MELIIIICLIICLVLMFLYFDFKFSTLRRKLMLTSSQFNKMSKDYSKIKKDTSCIQVKFSTPISQIGITNNHATIYLAPIITSPTIKEINIRMEVNILDRADINSETWYYINLPVDSNINCRGWIKKKDFSIIQSNSTNIKQYKYN